MVDAGHPFSRRLELRPTPRAEPVGRRASGGLRRALKAAESGLCRHRAYERRDDDVSPEERLDEERNPDRGEDEDRQTTETIETPLPHSHRSGI